MTGPRPPDPVLDFWTDPLRPDPLALFRILLGGTVLLSLLLSLAPALDRYLAPDGLRPPDNLDSWLKETHRYSLLRGPINLPVSNAAERGTGRRLGEMGREPRGRRAHPLRTLASRWPA